MRKEVSSGLRDIIGMRGMKKYKHLDYMTVWEGGYFMWTGTSASFLEREENHRNGCVHMGKEVQLQLKERGGRKK